MSQGLVYYLVFYFSLLSSCSTQETQNSQYLIFYDNSDCNATSTATFGEKVINNEGNFRSPGVAISSILINGMWRIRICPPEGGPCDEYLEHSSFAQKCFTLPEASESVGYTRFGDSGQNHSDVLYLFSNENFTGSVKEVKFSVEVKNLTAKSFYFTGFGNSWSLFESPVYNGEIFCIEPNESVKENAFGFTYSWSMDITGMSAKTSQCTNQVDGSTTTNPSTTEPTTTAASATSTSTTIAPSEETDGSTKPTTSVSETISSSTDPETTAAETLTPEASTPSITVITSDPTDPPSDSTNSTTEITTASTEVTSEASKATTTRQPGATYLLQFIFQILFSSLMFSTLDLSGF